MNWLEAIYGLGFGITWVLMTRWYVKGFDASEDPLRIAVGGFFGLFGGVLWPLVALSLLMGLAVQRVSR